MNAYVELKNVSLHIDTVEKPILNNINYTIHEGDFIIVLGSNGSGKSSLLKLLDRRYHPTQGTICINQKSNLHYPATEHNHLVVTLTQNCHESLFPSLTLFENYLLMKQRHSKNIFSIRTKQEKLFLQNYLAEFNVNLAKKLDMIVEKLSGGEKQALALALNVFYPPKILLLDEHTSALDPKTAQQLMVLTNKIVKENNITCILATHDLDIAKQYGTRILALRGGQVHLTIDHDAKQELDQQNLFSVCY